MPAGLDGPHLLTRQSLGIGVHFHVHVVGITRTRVAQRYLPVGGFAENDVRSTGRGYGYGYGYGYGRYHRYYGVEEE